jgi:uncharacterized protein DUF1615
MATVERSIPAPRRRWDPLSFLAALSMLTACVGPRPPQAPPPLAAESVHDLIDRSLPPALQDREGWNDDIDAAFGALSIRPDHENICAVVAVIEQESGFRVDPVIPGLPAIAWREIDARAARVGVPEVLLHGVLQLKSPNGRSYSERIDSARTEKDLSDVFEDFIASVPMGTTLFADKNPIRTRGPMQVNVAFVQRFSQLKPYPYPIKVSIEDEAFTRRGSLYFGMAHLLDYRAPYDRFMYRFADYNAGQYASRNAAFQKAVSLLSRQPLAADGALLPTASGAQDPGDTELAVRGLAVRLRISDSSIHGALEQGKTEAFEETQLYQRVFARAGEISRGAPLPRALVPKIKLRGPKITRNLTTEWYAQRVDERFKRCLSR